MWHGYLSGRNTACVNYLIPAKYICFGLAQSAPSRSVFAFPVRGKRSGAWTAAIATTCSAVVPSQRSLPPGDRTYLLTVSREQPESHKTNPWCALRFWVFCPRPEERNNMEIHVHLTKVKPIVHKTIKKFPNIIYQGKWDRTYTINIHPTYSYYQYFLASYSLVHFENRQVFLVKLANEHRYLRSSLLSLLYCHGACGRSSHLFELQSPLLWKE